MNKFISFISPIYNVNEYLPDLLESFTTLPKDKYELILVDDLGDQRPEEIIDKYRNLINIRVIKNQRNLGLGFARNEGLKNISKNATHFMFIDSDDLLDSNAWGQIYSASDDITLSSTFLMFSKTKKNIKKVWRNSFYKGAGVSSAWGHLISVKFKNVFFTSQFFEDQRYMSKITTGNNFGWFSEPIVNYRNRKSSILNQQNNSEKKARHISQFVEELTRSKIDGLISSKTSYKLAMIFAKVEFLYVFKKFRRGIKLNSQFFTIPMNVVASILALLERLTMFWWFYNKLSRGDYYD